MLTKDDVTFCVCLSFVKELISVVSSRLFTVLTSDATELTDTCLKTKEDYVKYKGMSTTSL